MSKKPKLDDDEEEDDKLESSDEEPIDKSKSSYTPVLEKNFRLENFPTSLEKSLDKAPIKAPLTIPKVRISKRPRSPSPVASTSSRVPPCPLPCPLPHPKTLLTVLPGTLAASAITLSPNATFLPNTITPRNYHSHNIKPAFDSRLGLIQTFCEEISRIHFQQKMLTDSLEFLQRRVDKLQKEYIESV